MSVDWRKPLYSFALPSRPIVVNVTRSCPNFVVPTPGVPDVAAGLLKEGKTRVLDFGAGRLRNALYLLNQKRGFKVWAVEFEEALATPVGQAKLAEANNHKNFFLRKWPHEFLESEFEVDAVLLINVANVVPEEEHRSKIIEECTRRLRRGGTFLWMSQYGEPHYKAGVTKRLRAPDGGWFYSLNKKEQTYYKEFSIAEIRAYFDPRHYREVKTLSAGHNRAFICERV